MRTVGIVYPAEVTPLHTESAVPPSPEQEPGEQQEEQEEQQEEQHKGRKKKG